MYISYGFQGHWEIGGNMKVDKKKITIDKKYTGSKRTVVERSVMWSELGLNAQHHVQGCALYVLGCHTIQRG